MKPIFLIFCIISLTLANTVLASASSSSQKCVPKIEKVIVNGTSMSPLLKDKQEVELNLNHYLCHPIKTGDIIVFESPGRPHRIIKTVFGIPKDKFEYKNNRIYINGKIIKNSGNKEYVLESKMLKLYSESYPTIPEDSYLVMGDEPSGSFDASKVGFIHRQQIVGKVLGIK